MTRIRVRQDIASDFTLGGRVVAAFGSLLFSVPVMGLLWLLFNSQIAPVSDRAISSSYLGAAVAAFAVLTFVFPRFAPNVFGWLCDLLVRLARWS